MMKSGVKMGGIAVALLVTFLVHAAHGFVPAQPNNSFGAAACYSSASTSLRMGLFDGFKKAFANEEYAAPPEGVKATARHILVKTADEANDVIDKLAAGSSFATLAGDFSTCPSGARGGSLGSFGPGTMVAEFDEVIFSPETNLGEVVGPVQTKFGYHLIVVDKRTGV